MKKIKIENKDKLTGYDFCRQRSERPYMKEHSDTIVPHLFVNKNSGSNLEQNWSKFSGIFLGGFWLIKRLIFHRITLI